MSDIAPAVIVVVNVITGTTRPQSWATASVAIGGPLTESAMAIDDVDTMADSAVVRWDDIGPPVHDGRPTARLSLFVRPSWGRILLTLDTAPPTRPFVDVVASSAVPVRSVVDVAVVDTTIDVVTVAPSNHALLVCIGTR